MTPFEIEQAHRLTRTALEAIADLERRVVATDGGRLKLEWAALRHRPEDGVRDLLCWERGALVGFLGIYGSGRRPFELTGMVDPGARRRGVGRRLFQDAVANCRERGSERLLLVVPRNGAGGAEFARALGLTYEHSEHALRLRELPADTAGPELSLRQATVDDIPHLSDLYRDGFHDDGHVDPSRLEGERSRTLIVSAAGGETIGTIALTREGSRGAVHGFVVGPRWRGRGFGRRALAHACRDLFDAGADHVDLEVEVDNERALGLYTSVGFEPLATDDYHELILSDVTGPDA